MNCQKKIQNNWVERGIEDRVYSKSQHPHRKGANSSIPKGKQFLFHSFPRRVTIATNLMGSHIAPFLITDFNMVSTVIIVLTFVIAVYGDECKDFKLSASDQSVIDMMRHYLHTSRKTECSDNKLSNTFKQINA